MTDTQKDNITGRWMYLISSLNAAHLWSFSQSTKLFLPLCKAGKRGLKAAHRDLLVDADLVYQESQIKFCKDCRSIYRTGHIYGNARQRRGQ